MRTFQNKSLLALDRLQTAFMVDLSLRLNDFSTNFSWSVKFSSVFLE